jgi:glycerol-3-phosphate O-acyltransferase
VSNLTDRATIRRTLQELVSSGVLSSYRAGTEAIWGEEAQQHLVAERRTVLCTPWWMPISA